MFDPLLNHVHVCRMVRLIAAGLVEGGARPPVSSTVQKAVGCWGPWAAEGRGSSAIRVVSGEGAMLLWQPGCNSLPGCQWFF